jgi:hypothetical protein
MIFIPRNMQPFLKYLTQSELMLFYEKSLRDSVLQSHFSPFIELKVKSAKKNKPNICPIVNY